MMSEYHPAEKFLSGLKGLGANPTVYLDATNDNPYIGIEKPVSRPNDKTMTDLSRQEVDAKISASEAKVEARLANFDTSVKTGFANLATEMAKQTAASEKQADALRVEMANIRAEMHKGTIDIVKWVVGFGIAILGTMFTLSKVSEKPSSPAPTTQNQPVILAVPAGTSVLSPTPQPPAPLQSAPAPKK